jgi:C4-dicarboxylate-specific signal transduction histidine kinase
MPPQRQVIKLAQFLGKLKLSASLDALARGTPFTMARHTEVQLRARVLSARALIDVEDRCVGLTTGAAETMLLPFAPSGDV